MELRSHCGVLLLVVAVVAGCSATTPPARSGGRASVGTNAPMERSTLAHAHYLAGVVLESGGNIDEALAEFHQAALLDPYDESLAVEVAQRLLARKQPENALEVLARVAAHPDASGEVFNHLGYVYMRLGRLDDAITANRRAIKKSPANLTGYQNLYLNYIQKDQRPDAYKVLESAAKVRDADAEFLVNLAELFANFSRQVPSQRTNANAAALKILERAVKLRDTPSVLRLKLADGFNLLGEDARARDMYQELFSAFPEASLLRANVRARLVEIYIREGDRKAAIEQLQAIVKDDPANLGVNLQLGDLAQDEHRYDLAEECFRKVVVLRPEFEPAYYELAQAQLGLDKPRVALATLADARSRFAPNYAGELLAGIAYGRLKEYDLAISRFTSAEVLGRASDPPRVNEAFYFQLGSIYERKGDLVQAEHYMQRSLELAPNFADAQNYLGYMWAERGTNLPAARELIEKAISAEPENAAFLDSLGWVLFKLGQPRDALSHLLQAIQLSELPDPTLFDHLGDVYFALDQQDQAREAWRKSLTLEPNDGIRKKLDSTPVK